VGVYGVSQVGSHSAVCQSVGGAVSQSVSRNQSARKEEKSVLKERNCLSVGLVEDSGAPDRSI